MVPPAARLGKIPPYLFGELARARAKAKAEGRELIDLGIGDPDQPTPEPILAALTRAAHDPATHRYDESDAGWPPFLASVAHAPDLVLDALELGVGHPPDSSSAVRLEGRA